MKPAYNMKSSAVKRILQEAKELSKEDSNEFEAHPLEDNIFEWHFTISGPEGTDFEGGRYHGRILLPAEYPFKPPHLIFLTPNGRFELHTKVCLSVTAHHEEHWQPSWGIRTVLLAVMGFLPTQSKGALGGLDYQKEERQRLAKRSKTWTCNVCGIKNEDFITYNKNKTASSVKKSEEKETNLPSFTFTVEPSNNTHGSENKYESSVQSSSKNNTNNESPSSEQCNRTSINDLSNKSQSSQYKTSISNISSSSSSSPSSVSESVPNENNSLKNSSKYTGIRTNQQASSSVSTDYIHPPIWLDFLIGALVSLLLYILYQRYT
ncbi:ubiquitin-conjugating enzyme/RWD-like protein [Cunninghamella echinulata]|nr:ubiquitin-conjugating enzyme/RWD-like protein [Cunninghamella echinulata]